MKKIILLFIVFLFVSLSNDAQTPKMDSLKTALQNAKQDTTRLRIYLALADVCDVEDNLVYAEPVLKLADGLLSKTTNTIERNKILRQKADAYRYIEVFYFDQGKALDYSKTIEFRQKRLAIFRELKDTIRIIQTILEISEIYGTNNNFPKRLEYLQIAIAVSKEMQFKKGTSWCLNSIAMLYDGQGDRLLAIDNYEKALAISCELKDTLQCASTLVQLGNINGGLHNVTKAVECFHKAKLFYEKGKSKSGVRFTYNCIALMYTENNDIKNALINFEKCLSLSEEMEDNYWIGVVLDNIGNLSYKQGDFQKALYYNGKALSVNKEFNDGYRIGFSYSNVAKSYIKLKDYKNAKKSIDHALEVRKKMPGSFPADYELLASEIDSAMNNKNGAYEHYKEYIRIRDQSESEEVKKAAMREKDQNEFDEQKKLAQKEQEKKDALAKAELKQQTLQRNGFIAGFGLMLLFAGVSYRNFRRKKRDNLIISEQKALVEEKQKEILDSIEYALRIQTAILPPQRIVKQYLENSFILYKPKDIVAGDFYWMEAVDDLILFAACDCTGHGVPGAMVSVVCHNALNRAVREFGLRQPAAILDKTAEIVVENFAKSEEDIKDGMDISLCAYHAKTKKMEWAGANNALWLIRNNELLETKADKQPIGMNEDSKPFTNHSFTLDAGDLIYLFTDGFADQFGGETGEKKLTRKRFKELLLGIQDKQMQEQGITLDKFIVNYRNEVEQIDDILVIGVKI